MGQMAAERRIQDLVPGVESGMYFSTALNIIADHIEKLMKEIADLKEAKNV